MILPKQTRIKKTSASTGLRRSSRPGSASTLQASRVRPGKEESNAEVTGQDHRSQFREEPALEKPLHPLLAITPPGCSGAVG